MLIFKAFAHGLIERPSYTIVKLYLIIGFVLNKLDCDYYWVAVDKIYGSWTLKDNQNWPIWFISNRK